MKSEDRMKIVFDEYLLAERVINRETPIFLLIDLGHWKSNKTNYALDNKELCDLNMPHIETEKANYMSFEMTFEGLNVFLHA